MATSDTWPPKSPQPPVKSASPMPRSTHGAVANRPSIVQKANATAIRAPAKGYNDGGKK